MFCYGDKLQGSRIRPSYQSYGNKKWQWELKKVKNEDPIEVSAIFEQVVENEEQSTSVKSKDYEDEVINLCKGWKWPNKLRMWWYEDIVENEKCSKFGTMIINFFLQKHRNLKIIMKQFNTLGWVETIWQKYNSIVENETWYLVSLLEGNTLITIKWILKSNN